MHDIKRRQQQYRVYVCHDSHFYWAVEELFLPMHMRVEKHHMVSIYISCNL
eukprot:XP_001710258.1 Hypothetical protein GL50803_4505 [Giardia lamblia ATCC 50803]